MRILNPPSQTQDSHHLRLSCLVHIRGETGQWVGHFHGRAHSAARTLWKKRQHQQLKDSFQSPHPSAPPFSSSSAHLEVSLYRKLNLMETFPRLIPFRHSHSPPAEHWHLKGKECSSCMSSAAPVPIILRECFIHIEGYIYTHYPGQAGYSSCSSFSTGATVLILQPRLSQFYDNIHSPVHQQPPDMEFLGVFSVFHSEAISAPQKSLNSF